MLQVDALCLGCGQTGATVALKQHRKALTANSPFWLARASYGPHTSPLLGVMAFVGMALVGNGILRNVEIAAPPLWRLSKQLIGNCAVSKVGDRNLSSPWKARISTGWLVEVGIGALHQYV